MNFLITFQALIVTYKVNSQSKTNVKSGSEPVYLKAWIVILRHVNYILRSKIFLSKMSFMPYLWGFLAKKNDQKNLNVERIRKNINKQCYFEEKIVFNSVKTFFTKMGRRKKCWWQPSALYNYSFKNHFSNVIKNCRHLKNFDTFLRN